MRRQIRWKQPNRRTCLVGFFLSLSGLLLPGWLKGDEGAEDRSQDTEAVELFSDGSLEGWIAEGAAEREGKGGEKAPVWTIEDGRLVCRGGGFGFLRYDQRVCDFRLSLEYRLPEGGNSGLGIRTVQYDPAASRATRPSFAAYEVQLLDDAGKPPNDHGTASLYRYVAPTSNPSKPAGEWNRLEIECRGPRIRIWLNGEQVQDVDQSRHDELREKPLCGYIALQNHGSRSEFRNLRLKVYDSGT